MHGSAHGAPSAVVPHGGPPIPVAIAITSPPAGGTAGNPITVSGTVSPVTCTVTCKITVGGMDYPGTVTGPDPTGRWSATFPPIPSGTGTITGTANQGGNSANTTQGITVK